MTPPCAAYNQIKKSLANVGVLGALAVFGTVQVGATRPGQVQLAAEPDLFCAFGGFAVRLFRVFLATSGGARAPLAHIANQVFNDLATELERQGLSRKVTADMFGISLRSYQRKLARLRESSSDRGRSMWEAVLEFLVSRGITTRVEVLERFGSRRNAKESEQRQSSQEGALARKFREARRRVGVRSTT